MHPQSTGMKRSKRWLPEIVASVAVFMLLAPGGRAQETPPVPRPVQVVLENIGDLAILHALLPLKLTADQTTKLLTPLKTIAADNQKRIKTDQNALLELAPDVEKARTAALAGGTIPTDLEARVKQIFKAAETRYNTVRKRALDQMLAVVKETLTPTQKDEIEAESVKTFGGRRVPAAYRSNPSKAPREAVQELALLAFVDDVLLSERAPLVLTQMKPPAP